MKKKIVSVFLAAFMLITFFIPPPNYEITYLPRIL